MTIKGSWNRVTDHKSYGQNYAAIFSKKHPAKTPHTVSAGDSGRGQGEPELLSQPGSGAEKAGSKVSPPKSKCCGTDARYGTISGLIWQWICTDCNKPCHIK